MFLERIMSNGSVDDGSDTSRTRRKFLKYAATSSTAVTAGLSGCLGGGDGDGDSDQNGTVTGTTESQYADELTLYTWGGDAAKNVENNIVNPFQEEHGISVNMQTFGDPFQVLSKLKAGTIDADVIVTWPEALVSGLRNDPPVWGELRYDNLTNYDNVIDDLKPQNADYDPTGNSSLPIAFGGNGAVYNYEQVDKPQSWSDLYTDQLEGQLGYSSSMSILIGTAATELGINFNELSGNSSSDMQAVWDQVRMQKEYVYEWWDTASSMQQLVTDGSALAGILWYGRTFSLREFNDVPVRWTIPEEGASAWTDIYAMPAGRSDQQKRTAELWLDYNLRDDVVHRVSEAFPVARPLKFKDMGPPESLLENPNYTNPEKLSFWDPSVLLDHKEDWTRKFQEILRE